MWRLWSGFAEGQTAQHSAIEGPLMPDTPPPELHRTKDPGVTFLPHSHKHSAYRLFKWSGELQHTPTLSCSVANLFTVIFSSHLSLEVIQAGKPLGKGINSPSAMPVTSFLAFARKGGRDKFLVTSPARTALAAHTIGQGCENRRAPQLQQILRREKATPGMS